MKGTQQFHRCQQIWSPVDGFQILRPLAKTKEILSLANTQLNWPSGFSRDTPLYV
jgi:hypothetical protein